MVKVGKQDVNPNDFAIAKSVCEVIILVLFLYPSEGCLESLEGLLSSVAPRWHHLPVPTT